MRYIVLKPLVFGGLSYEVGQEIDIFEKSVSQNCLERKLIGETDKKTTPAENTENQEEGTTGDKDEATSEEVTKTKEKKQSKAKKQQK